MKKLFTLFVAGMLVATAGAQGIFQFQNSDFEQWEDVKYNDKTQIAPVAWHSYLTGTGAVKANAVKYAAPLEKGEARTGSAGTTSVLVKGKNYLTLNLAGNLTTGCVEMGHLNQGNTAVNYNYTNISSGQAMQFTGRPDAMKVWVRFHGVNKGQIAAYLHSAGRFQFPIATGDDITGQMVGSAAQFADSNDQWTEYTIPFNYVGNDNPAYALVSFTTTNIPGKGSKDDYMYIDDISLVYNSELSEIMYNGKSILGKISVDAEYDESLLSGLKSNGAGATITHQYNPATYVLTVKVTAQDNSSEHTYTYQFRKPTVYYTVTFLTYDGQTIVTKTIKEGDPVVAPNAPAREGYTFTGWDPDIVSPAQADATYTATYEEIIPEDVYYTVTFLNYNGETIFTTQIKEGDRIIVPENPVREGYTFMGWTPAIVEIVTSNATYMATYEKDEEPEPVHEWPSAGTVSTYEDNVTVTINGQKGDPQPCVVNVKYGQDGVIDFALNDFILISNGDEIPVGNIKVQNISQEWDRTIAAGKFSFTGNITIPEGSDPEKFWMGPYLGVIPMQMTGEMNDQELHVQIFINLMSTMGQMVQVEVGNELGKDAEPIITYKLKPNSVTFNPSTLTYDATSVQMSYVILKHSSKADVEDVEIPRSTTLDWFQTNEEKSITGTYYDSEYKVEVQYYILKPAKPAAKIDYWIKPGSVTYNPEVIPYDATYVNLCYVVIKHSSDESVADEEINRTYAITWDATDDEVKMSGTYTDPKYKVQVPYSIWKLAKPAWMMPTSGTKTYSEDLYVGVDGKMNGPMDSEVQITFHDDNTIDLALYNFILKSGDSDPMYVGNILIENVGLTDTGQHYSTFEYNGNLDIAAGTDPADAMWMGPLLGTLPLPTAGKINNEQLFVTIKLHAGGQDIDVQVGNKAYFDNLDGEDFTGLTDFVTARPSSNTTVGSCYNLQGQRVNPSAKGIHVVNGRLVLKL